MTDIEKKFVDGWGSVFGGKVDLSSNGGYSVQSVSVSNMANFEEIKKEVDEIKQKVNGVKVTVPERAEVTKILGLDLTDPKKTYIFVLSFPEDMDKATMALSANKFREAVVKSSNSVKANIIVSVNVGIDVVEGG